jgi:hypothetical protein
MGEVEAPQHDRLHGAEDRGRGTDAEGEGQDGHGGEPRRARELAQGEARVLHRLRDVFDRADLFFSLFSQHGALLPDLVEIAETPSRFFARGGGAEAARGQLARTHLQVERQLVVDLALDARPSEE